MNNKLLLRINDVCTSVGLCKATIYKLIAKNQFPRPVKLSSRAVAWRHESIKAWTEALVENNKSQGALNNE